MSNTQKELALEVLTSGLSVEKASEMANVSRQTIYNWMKQKTFQRALKARQREYFERLSRRMMTITLKALDVIEESLTSRSEANRLRASGLALSSLPQVLSLTEFEERITELEEALKNGK